MWVLTDLIRSSYTNYTPPAAFLTPVADHPIDVFPPSPNYARTPATDPSPALLIPPNPAPSPSPLGFLICRSTRANRGTRTNTRYQDKVF